MGCLLSAPSDSPGTNKHRTLAILAAAILGASTYIVAGYLNFNIYATLAMLLVLIFFIAYLSVYGFRASLVTFSGLMAVVLSFANISSTVEIWQKGLLIFSGGLWYLSLSSLWNFFFPKQATEQLLAETMELTADYLRIRAKLMRKKDQPEALQKEIFQLQNQLNEHHELLRELLLTSRSTSGNSVYARKRLLVFVDLVDILELAMSHPIDASKMKEDLGEHFGELEYFAEYSKKLANQLEKIALKLFKNSRLPEIELKEALASNYLKFREFRNRVNISEKRKALLVLRNLYDYQEKQTQKIYSIDRILRNIEFKRNLLFSSKEREKFLSPQEYSFKEWKNNFNFNSNIFRHSLRMAIAVVVGYLIGFYFSVNNSYWILLTIVVIMRPNYGLTKERTKKRIIGTLVGAAVAIGIVFITQNTTVYAILAIVSLTLAFSLIQKNYTTAAIFITLSIIFIYALLKPDVLSVIQYRVIDTSIGALIAWIANIALWPKWEVESIAETIKESIKANLEYFKEINQFYHQKGTLPTTYKLSRKGAFLEMGNLSESFQRMSQEPKSQQDRLKLIFEIVSLNQTFLSSLASLGTFIRTHPTSPASKEFDTYIDKIQLELKNSIHLLKHRQQLEDEIQDFEAAEHTFYSKFDELASKRDKELAEGKNEIDESFRFKLQEAHLVTNQLGWLLEIARKMNKSIKKINPEFYE
ncbi:FUSC family protein [Gramella sp. AN32]|nr:FUSC family protein [Gramella sp. AN32]